MRIPYLCAPSVQYFSRFLFSIRWPPGSRFEHLSTPLVKFISRSYHTTRNLVGFFKYFNESAQSLGVQDASLFGLPFSLTLTKRTRAAAQKQDRRQFFVLTASPEIDIFAFLVSQRERLDLISARSLPIALTDDTQTAPQVLLEDYRSVSGPGEN